MKIVAEIGKLITSKQNVSDSSDNECSEDLPMADLNVAIDERLIDEEYILLVKL